jgi:cell fate regulator YaaT (PSP1 superfamily)
MKQWAIRDGISQEAKDIIKKLAKEKKVTIGECLNEVILESLSTQDKIEKNLQKTPENITQIPSHFPTCEALEDQEYRNYIKDLLSSDYNNRYFDLDKFYGFHSVRFHGKTKKHLHQNIMRYLEALDKDALASIKRPWWKKIWNPR